MALVKCPDCGKMFSEHAKCCPDCACPISVAKEAAKPVPTPKPVEKKQYFLAENKNEETVLSEFNALIKKLLPDHEFIDEEYFFGFYNKAVVEKRKKNIFYPCRCEIKRNFETKKLELLYREGTKSRFNVLPLTSKSEIENAWSKLRIAYNAKNRLGFEPSRSKSYDGWDRARLVSDNDYEKYEFMEELFEVYMLSRDVPHITSEIRRDKHKYYEAFNNDYRLFLDYYVATGARRYVDLFNERFAKDYYEINLFAPKPEDPKKVISVIEKRIPELQKDFINLAKANEKYRNLKNYVDQAWNFSKQCPKELEKHKEALLKLVPLLNSQRYKDSFRVGTVIDCIGDLQIIRTCYKAISEVRKSVSNFEQEYKRIEYELS